MRFPFLYVKPQDDIGWLMKKADKLRAEHCVRIMVNVKVVDEFSEKFDYSRKFELTTKSLPSKFARMYADTCFENGAAKIKVYGDASDKPFELNVYDYVFYDYFAKAPFEYRIKCSAFGNVGRVNVQVKCSACAEKSAYDVARSGHKLAYDWWSDEKARVKCERLEKINDFFRKFRFIPDGTMLDAMDDGWRNAFGIRMCKEIRAELIKYPCWLFKYRILQIKQKYGGLRWYDCGYPRGSKIPDILSKYELLSMSTCIDCGRPAKWMTTGYILPYCDECVDKLNHFGKTIREAGVKPNLYYYKNNETEEYHEQIAD